MKRKMYATVRRYEAVEDPAAAAKQVDEKFVPLISALPGSSSTIGSTWEPAP